MLTQAGSYVSYPGLATKEVSAPESTPIRDAVTSAEQMISALAEAIASLEQRLDTVLRPMPPATQNSGPVPPGLPASHLLGRLRLLNEAFGSLHDRLTTLTGRIEV